MSSTRTTLNELARRRYTGDSWNVYYEWSIDGDIYGHSGEYADELDAWFTAESEAMEFFDTHFPQGELKAMLREAPPEVDYIIARVEVFHFEDGMYDFGDEIAARIVENES